VAAPRSRRLASPPDPDGHLRLVEARLARLEGDVASVQAGGRPRPLAPTRTQIWSRWLLVGGLVLIVAAIVTAAH
jgi:hypothetical protein